MISMDRENGDGHINIQILVVHMVKRALEILTRVTDHLQFTRLVPQAVHPDGPHHLIHGLPGWLVFMEQIPRQENHVDILFFGHTHHLMETLPTIISPDGISLVVADMIVSRDENADCLRVYTR